MSQIQEKPEHAPARTSELEYHLLDVFTDRVGGGNPVAVFAEAHGVAEPLMARIARELALSETVFVFPAETPEGTRRLRIFTPTGELPFAGHPTIGTAVLLARLGVAPTPGVDGDTHIVLEEGVGPVRVRLRVVDGAPVFAELAAAKLPEFGTPPDPSLLPALLSLEPDEIGLAPFSPAAVSCGVPYALVPVRDRAALARARLNVKEWQRHFATAWAPHFYVYTLDASGAGAQIRARMFAPALGIEEDPATGAAALDLAAYLASRDDRRDGTLRWTIHQGVEMGRPSVLEVAADKQAGGITAVRVGGRAVIAGTPGEWHP